MQDVHEQPLTRGLFLPPLIQILISGTGFLISLLFTVFLFLVGISNLLGGSISNQELLPFFSMGWSALLVAVLLLPSLMRAARLLAGKQPQEKERNLFPLALAGLILWGPVVLLGHWIAQQQVLPWLLLPPLQLLGVALPIFFWIELGRRKLSQNPEASGGGVFSFGVVITQPLVIIVEIILLVVLVVLFVVWVAMQPDLLAELTRLGQRMTNAQMDPKLLEAIILPYLQRPGVIFLGLAVGAGFIPIVEELLKPLAVWVMVRRKFSGVQGFVMGLYAGGTFALLESLGMLASATATDWSSVVVARLGTGILHVTTAALVGWGLGTAWEKHKYGQLGVVFILSVTLHGIWNMFGLLLGMVPYIPGMLLLPNLDFIGPLALGILAAVMLLIIIGGNRMLRSAQSNIPLEDKPEIPEPGMDGA
jgi:hypothetical protein